MKPAAEANANETPTPASRSGFGLFQVAGIKVRADWSWLIIFALVLVSLSAGYLPSVRPEESTATYWVAGLLTTLLFFGSLILHELSHAFIATRAGIDVPRITLFLFGGMSEMKEEPPTPEIELRVAVVGPLTSAALAAGFLGLSQIMPAEPWYLSAVSLHLAVINLALAIFNLLPGYPLDGGRMLRAVVWRTTGSLQKATRVAAGAGQAFGVALMVLGAIQLFLGAGLLGGFWMILIGLFLRAMAGQGYESLMMRRALADGRVDEVMTPADSLVPVSPDLTLDVLVDEYFVGHGYRGFPVLGPDGEVLGQITLDAVRGRDRDEWPRTAVREVMTPLDEQTRIAPDAPLIDAMRRIGAGEPGRLLVLRDGRLEGCLTRRDLNRYIEVRTVALGSS